MDIKIAKINFSKTQEFQPFLWLRYINSIFFIWMHREAELKKFMEHLSTFLLSLKFKYESSKKSPQNGSVSTDLHTKCADCHQYLHYSSSYTDHIKNSIIYSQAATVNNISS